MTFNMDVKWNPYNKDQVKLEDEYKIYRMSAHNPRLLNFHGHTPYRELMNIHLVPRMTFARTFRNYDVVHFHDDIDLSFPFFSILERTKRKARLMHCHSLPYTYGKYKKNLLAGFLLRKSADLYVGLSKYTVMLLLELGLPKDKLTILPNAVDTEVFKPGKKPKEDNLILYAARITEGKGLDFLLGALFHLTTPTQLAIAGPVGDKSFFSRVQFLIRKINSNTAHKVFYLGEVSNTTLLELHQKATVFVCPSITDHLPISNLEALACGTPVVGTRVGAIPEIIQDDFNGFVVPPRDALALASALQKILGDRELRNRLGRNGRKMIEEHFSWGPVVEKLTRVYECLLSSHKDA